MQKEVEEQYNLFAEEFEPPEFFTPECFSPNQEKIIDSIRPHVILFSSKIKNLIFSNKDGDQSISLLLRAIAADPADPLAREMWEHTWIDRQSLSRQACNVLENWIQVDDKISENQLYLKHMNIRPQDPISIASFLDKLEDADFSDQILEIFSTHNDIFVEFELNNILYFGRSFAKHHSVQLHRLIGTVLGGCAIGTVHECEPSYSPQASPHLGDCKGFGEHA
jgi:hypothetical protein